MFVFLKCNISRIRDDWFRIRSTNLATVFSSKINDISSLMVVFNMPMDSLGKKNCSVPILLTDSSNSRGSALESHRLHARDGGEAQGGLQSIAGLLLLGRQHFPSQRVRQ